MKIKDYFLMGLITALIILLVYLVGFLTGYPAYKYAGFVAIGIAIGVVYPIIKKEREVNITTINENDYIVLKTSREVSEEKVEEFLEIYDRDNMIIIPNNFDIEVIRPEKVKRKKFIRK